VRFPRSPHCLDSRLTDGGEVVSLMFRPRFAPRKIRYSFLLETDLILLPWCGWKDQLNWNISMSSGIEGATPRLIA
jgi:hypothetical protein